MLYLLILKHYLCEIQNSYLATGKAKATGWVLPLLIHAFINAAGTALVLLAFSVSLYLVVILSLVEILVHGTIDRTKAVLGQKYNAMDANKQGYHLLYVADQSLHFAWLVLIYQIVC